MSDQGEHREVGLRQRLLRLLKDFDCFASYATDLFTREEVYLCVGCHASIEVDDPIEAGNHFPDCEVRAVVKLLEEGAVLD